MSITKTKLAELRQMAEERKVKGFENKNRAELVKALTPLLEKEEKAKEAKEGKLEDQGSKDNDPKDDKEPESEKEDSGKESNVEEPSLGDVEEVEKVDVGGKAERMKQQLAKQEKVLVMIPLDQGEKKGSTFSVILNGYRMNVRKGTYVKVPKQVAEIIRDCNDQTIAADEEFKRLEDGKPMLIDDSGGSPEFE